MAEINYELLTQRELNVLRWCAGSKTDWEVSVILGVDESTVWTHVNSAMNKFGCSNRTTPVVNAIRAGLTH